MIIVKKLMIVVYFSFFVLICVSMPGCKSKQEQADDEIKSKIKLQNILKEKPILVGETGDGKFLYKYVLESGKEVYFFRDEESFYIEKKKVE